MALSGRRPIDADEDFAVILAGVAFTLPERSERRGESMPVEDLRQSPMMSHMLDALDRGEDIGHLGRLSFPMVAPTS